MDIIDILKINFIIWIVFYSYYRYGIKEIKKLNRKIEDLDALFNIFYDLSQFKTYAWRAGLWHPEMSKIERYAEKDFKYIIREQNESIDTLHDKHVKDIRHIIDYSLNEKIPNKIKFILSFYNKRNESKKN